MIQLKAPATKMGKEKKRRSVLSGHRGSFDELCSFVYGITVFGI